MKTQLINIKFAFYLLSVTLLFSCKLATQLSKQKVNDNLMVRYALYYNNRTANHKPVGFYVSYDTLNTKIRNHSLYIFYLNSDTVEKFHDYNRQRANYILINDSTENNSNDRIFSITNMESEMFEKIIYFSDSLKLKDFRFLKKADGFKISSQKLGYYLKAK